jgi:tRNA(Ile)-lysidine synthase
LAADAAFLADLRAALERACAAVRGAPGSRGASASRGAGGSRTPAPGPRFAVALSGGLDSTVLLTALTRLEPRPAVRALHVDHGLHADSAEWDRRCAELAAALGVPYRSVRVAVDLERGIGLEAAAREARYAALAALLEPGEVLLTAHHADDQLETVLHRLARGTGVRGLRGILAQAPLGAGFVARPLLGMPRARLRALAEQWGLEWLEDPSNSDLDYDRNYLRSTVLPALRARWPAAAAAAERLAEAAADAEEILAAVARDDLAPMAGEDSRAPREDRGAAAGEDPGAAAGEYPGAAAGEHPRLAAGDPGAAAREEPSGRTATGRPALAALVRLGPVRRRNALRYAIRSAGLPMPSARQLETLCASLEAARPDARTCVRWPGGEARVYAGRLYLSAPLEGDAGDWEADASHGGASGASRLSAGEPWSGPAGRLSIEPASGPGLPEAIAREGLEVRFRSGGERFKPAGSPHTRKLKQWFQEQGIVPWMRDRIPLLYWRERLVAVADLAVAADLPAADPNEGAWRVRWDAHPPIR